jgi:hypothetical protein
MYSGNIGSDKRGIGYLTHITIHFINWELYNVKSCGKELLTLLCLVCYDKYGLKTGNGTCCILKIEIKTEL